MKDLADLHNPIGKFIQQPVNKITWKEFRLTDEQIYFFNENGYLSNIKLLEEWQVDILRDELAQITDSTYSGNSLFHYYNSNESSNQDSVLLHALGAWRIMEGFHDVLWNPAFLMAASQLLGNKSVRFWHDQLFCKPAHHGGVVAWHQDYSYWTRTVPMQHLTCWIGLDDATVDNGCLLYIPKSHKWSLLEKPELAGEMDSIKTVLSEEQLKEFLPVPIEMKKGYGTFHHPLLLHGSNENKSNSARRAFVLNVFADGTLSDTKEEQLQGIPAIMPGNKLEGKFFPLLYTAS